MAQKARKREVQRREVVPVEPDWLVVGLAVAGFIVAGYLTWLKWAGHGALLCVAGSGCDLVQASRYSTFVGLPTALWGAALYAAVGILGALGLTANRWLAAFLIAAGGVGFSVYLTALSVFVIGGACIYCLTSGAILVGLLVALVWRRPLAHGRKSPLRPAPLATSAILVALATIVIGAFVFATPTPAPAGYQMALARHLKQSGAIMYGAYW